MNILTGNLLFWIAARIYVCRQVFLARLSHAVSAWRGAAGAYWVGHGEGSAVAGTCAPMIPRSEIDDLDAKGRKTGGRKKGSLNKATLARQEALADLVVDAKDPVSFFTSIMRDDTPAADWWEDVAVEVHNGVVEKVGRV